MHFVVYSVGRLPGVKAGLGNLYDCPFFMLNRPPPALRTIIYVDGLNFYYGAVKGTPRWKWLDIERFCKLLRPHDDIRQIRYFSSLIQGPTKSNQEAYLKALSTSPLVGVILGKFKMKK